MRSRKFYLFEMKPFTLLFENNIESYLNQCRVKNRLVESDDAHVPPTAEETKFLIKYLRDLGLKPAIVGSVGILRHLGSVDPKNDFRPTVDLDVWVTKVPAPPKGWSRDHESIGVESWISPSGGYVDFMTPGHEFPGGTTNPKSIAYDPASAETDYPVAHWLDLLKMKLNSMRSKDLSDSIALIRKMKAIPSTKELGKLTQTQKENLDLVTQWFNLRPIGKYGE